MSRFATSPCSHAACHRISHPMKKLSLIAALLLGATPVAAQSVSGNVRNEGSGAAVAPFRNDMRRPAAEAAHAKNSSIMNPGV